MLQKQRGWQSRGRHQQALVNVQQTVGAEDPNVNPFPHMGCIHGWETMPFGMNGGSYYARPDFRSWSGTADRRRVGHDEGGLDLVASGVHSGLISEDQSSNGSGSGYPKK